MLVLYLENILNLFNTEIFKQSVFNHYPYILDVLKENIRRKYIIFCFNQTYISLGQLKHKIKGKYFIDPSVKCISKIPEYNIISFE